MYNILIKILFKSLRVIKLWSGGKP